MRIKIVILFSTILFVQSSGCNRNSYATLHPFTPTVMPLQDVYEVMLFRYGISEDAIAVLVEFKRITLTKQTNKFLDSRRIELVVHFKNVSSNSVIFRTPISYGFVGPDGSVNDVEIFIETKNGPPMNITSTSNYPHPGETSSFPNVTLEDFISIEPGNVFSYQLEVAPPPIYIEETKYRGKLLPGTYKLKVEYNNYDIGYELPLDVTPPVSFDNYQAELEWYDNNTMVVDLNAWVGWALSNEVEITIPAE